MKKIWLVFLALCSINQFDGFSQSIQSLEESFSYRFLGPYRGGRSTAVKGCATKPHYFLMGTTGGGVWETDDAGNSWKNISDGQIKCGSIGSIAIHPKYPDILYVGTGSDSPRGNVSAGIGIYKSGDGGKTWTHKGLNKAGQIGDIIFHPDNPDIVYVAALGNIFGPNQERGVYKTIDGGSNWDQVLFLNDSTGAVDLDIHPNNPDVLYAALWRVERKPWTLIDGGSSSGLYKTTNAGKDWQKVDSGLPDGLIGKIGISISPADPNIIYTIIQSAKEEDGGVYKSVDGGQHFNRINGDHKLRQRGWYYTRIFADPVDKNTVYVTNTGFYRSIDGGQSFSERLRVPHGDCHDVWINPENPAIMINSNDGGGTITLNGGNSWSTPYNQPTAEIYRLTTDNNFPFRVYGGQQDNSTISVSSRRRPGVHPKTDWLVVGGGESADVAVLPSNPNIVYATTYSGIITKVNLATGEDRYVGAYPHYTEGTEMRNLKYRMQWNFPIRISQHDEGVLYHTSQYVHKSTDEGNSWQIISPDLTRNIEAYQGIPGGPIQHDATGVEVYSSLFALSESPFDANEIWVGSDDGRLHRTTNGGTDWVDITPEDMPYEGTINHIELSKHDREEAYVVVYNYRYADFTPYIFKTSNAGKRWFKITDGIDDGHFVRAFAQDPVDRALLFAGTEYGMYASLDGGENWKPFQKNLPHTPITDMEIKGDALVLSTQGRGFWMIDDISPLRDWEESIAQKNFYLFNVSDTYKSNAGRNGGRHSPPSAPYQVHYWVWALDTTQDLSMQILDGSGGLVYEQESLKCIPGVNHFSWNMETAPPFMVEDLMMMDMRHPGEGPAIPPGDYRLEIQRGDEKLSKSFSVLLDPHWTTSAPNYDAQFALAKEIATLINQSQEELQYLRAVKEELLRLKEKVNDETLLTQLEELAEESKELQDMIYQDQILTSQDEINFERKFTNHLIRLYRVVLGQHGAPTAGERERWTDVQQEYEPFKLAFSTYIRKISKLDSDLKKIGVNMLKLKDQNP